MASRSNSKSLPNCSYKEKKTFDKRFEESNRMRDLHPIKIPVVIERFKGEKVLPLLDKSKFLIPSHMEMFELIQIVRRRLHLQSHQAMFLLVNGKNIPGNAETIREIYEKECDQDGFLYIAYMSHEVFGASHLLE